MKLRPYFIAPFVLQATIWRIIMRPFFNAFTSFNVVGLENLKELPGSLIFAPNHSSELDAVLLPLALPLWSRFEPMFYVVKGRKFYKDPSFKWRRHVYQQWIFHSLGAYETNSGHKDYGEALKKHIKILNDGGSVCIFPEGGFSKDGSIGKAHGGVAFLGAATKCLIIPVLIKGTYKISLSEVFLMKRKIEVVFLKPVQVAIDVSALSGDELHSHAEHIMSEIKIAKEVYAD